VIATIRDQEQSISVACHIAFDGVEYVGRLWFLEEGGSDAGIPDRAAIPGRNRDEVLALARRLTSYELVVRHRRAVAEKRRFIGLRRVTDDILVKIRYLNQVAISMRAGLIDSDGANQEMELTQRQILECVDKLRDNAGVEG
ncbi:MAG TPA: hypothetical protein VMH39_07100, partial [Gemmatimonadaceae bacterium]|nr:hypothetical protein [Gemmatimonadaceae bacterium]